MPVSSTAPDYIHASVRALPVLPTAVARLLGLAKEIDVDFAEIARVIETDQTLMARTLRAANSPLYSVSRQIKTVRQATVLLGTETIVNLALGISVMSFQSGLHKQLPLDPAAFGRHSIAVALLARRLAEHFGVGHPGEAFVAGLLHDIGKLVLLMHFGTDYAALMARAHAGEAPLHVMEQDAFGVDHALAGHALCLHWNLPPTLAQAVAEHHAEPAPRSLGEVVGRANDLVKAFGLGESGNRFVPASPVTDQPRDQINPDWLRHVARKLGPETQQAEAALGQGAAPAPAEAAPAPADSAPVVLVQVNAPVEREVIASMLLAHGFDPRPALATAPSEPPVAVITEAPPTDGLRERFAQRGMPVVDYGSWRSRQQAGWVDVAQLREWLSEAVGAPAFDAMS